MGNQTLSEYFRWRALIPSTEEGKSGGLRHAILAILCRASPHVIVAAHQCRACSKHHIPSAASVPHAQVAGVQALALLTLLARTDRQGQAARAITSCGLPELVLAALVGCSADLTQAVRIIQQECRNHVGCSRCWAFLHCQLVHVHAASTQAMEHYV